MSENELDDTHLHTLAVRLVLGVMRSASTEKIRPMDWWSRAQSALHSAAAMSARSFGQMTSVMGRKLQIDTYNASSASVISSIGEQLTDPDLYEAFRSLCERDALYVVAEAQARRQIERELKERKNDGNGSEIGEAGL